LQFVELKKLKKDNCVYSGLWDTLKDCREGFGVQIWPEHGSKYIGAWHEDRAEGPGRLIMENGDLYEGNWLKDRLNGYGKCILVS
jgi:hypothetical protein